MRRLTSLKTNGLMTPFRSGNSPGLTTKGPTTHLSSTTTVSYPPLHIPAFAFVAASTKDISAGLSAMSRILQVVDEQSQPTFDDSSHIISHYNWSGTESSPSPMVPNGGNGEPKAFTGMVGTSHRPSDDLGVFGASSPCWVTYVQPYISNVGH